MVSSPSLPGLVYQGSELDSFFKALNRSVAVQTDIIAGKCTVLAPTNEAFAAYNVNGLSNDELDALLRYHVLRGIHASEDLQAKTAFIPTLLQNTSYTNVTSSQVVEAESVDGEFNLVSGLWKKTSIATSDIIFNNGLIQAIDGVLTIPTVLGDTVTQAHLTAYLALGEELGTVTPPNEPFFSEIQVWPDVTILAPNNSDLPTNYPGWNDLSASAVLDIWKYHLINGSVLYSTDLVSGRKFKTSGGLDVSIYHVNGSTFINEAKILQPDLMIANGVMQIIDRPLNPNDTAARPKQDEIQSIRNPSNASGLSFGAKAGIGIGVALVVLVLIVIGYCFFKRRRRSPTIPTDDNEEKKEEAQLDSSDVREMPNEAPVQKNELGTTSWELSAIQPAHELESERSRLELP